MKQSKSIRPKSVLVVLAFIFASTIPGAATLIQVPADYSTIQAAVDAANTGDTIQIAAGIYTNQVVIAYKNLTLSGSPGTVLRATPAMQSTLEPYVAGVLGASVLAVFESTNVVVSGLTFEGERLADSLPESDGDIFDAIWFFEAGGRVENCRITGFRGTTLGTTNSVWGVGVHVVNSRFGSGVINVDVVRNTFADNTKSIMLIGDGGPGFDPNLLLTTFAVNDNTIVGNGPDANGRQLGIHIVHGCSGEVKRNTITDHAYTGTSDPDPFSYGIVADDDFDFGVTNLQALQPIHFEGNILRNNQLGLLLLRGDNSTVVNNSFDGAGPGYRPAGLLFSGENVVVATNRFGDMDTGIVLFGNDPDFGKYLGIASNAVLTANGFCNVATNYVYEPLTTHTEQGTVTCPWPTLDIRAVQLSWPYSYSGYSVQSASAMNGPWSMSEATPFLQDGRNNVLILAASGQQFFRLVKP